MLFPDRIPVDNSIITDEFIEQYDLYLQKRRIHHYDYCQSIVNSNIIGTLVEVSLGWGYTGIDIVKQMPNLSLVTVGNDDSVLRKAMQNANKEGIIERWGSIKMENDVLPFNDESVDAITSTNLLRKLDNPYKLLKEMWRVTKVNRPIYINDLRRDANEFIAEYLIRELREDNTPFGKFSLDTFIKSWRASYTIEEIQDVLKKAGIEDAVVEEDGAMTFTVVLTKKG